MRLRQPCAIRYLFCLQCLQQFWFLKTSVNSLFEYFNIFSNFFLLYCFIEWLLLHSFNHWLFYYFDFTVPLFTSITIISSSPLFPSLNLWLFGSRKPRHKKFNHPYVRTTPAFSNTAIYYSHLLDPDRCLSRICQDFLSWRLIGSPLTFSRLFWRRVPSPVILTSNYAQGSLSVISIKTRSSLQKSEYFRTNVPLARRWLKAVDQ